jgi:hypothetical protein
LIKKHTTVEAEANLELVYYKGKLWLKLIRTVNKGDELFWKYGSGFHLNGTIDETFNHDLGEESDSDSDSDDTDAHYAAVATAAAVPERTSNRVRGFKISDADWRAMRK